MNIFFGEIELIFSFDFTLLFIKIPFFIYFRKIKSPKIGFYGAEWLLNFNQMANKEFNGTEVKFMPHFLAINRVKSL